MEAAGYGIDLYCDYCDSITKASQYFGETRSECLKQARKHGWTYHRDGTHSCKYCKGKAIE